MTNEQKYKTVEERGDAFAKFCDSRGCGGQCSICEVGKPYDGNCILRWLVLEALEVEEPKPDLPFEIASKIVRGGYISVIRRADTKEEVANFPVANEYQCDALNAAALAWHKRMCEKEGNTK